MGAAVATQSGASSGEEIVGKARAILLSSPSLTNEEVLKQLGTDLSLPVGGLSDSAVAKLRSEAGSETKSNAVLWEEMCALSVEKEDDTVVVPGTEECARSASEVVEGGDDNEKRTVSMMSPEFKRPQSSKKVLYPPLSESAPRPFPRNVAASFSCHGQSDVGKFKDNQDRGVVCYPFNCTKSENRALFIVADGHGEHGHNVSDFVVKDLITELSCVDYDNEKDMDFEAIRSCFLRTNEHCGHPDCTFDAQTSGTTCVAALLRPTYVVTANVGDSRAVVGRRAGDAPSKAKTPFLYKAHDLTVDHKPDSTDEKERIEKAGGFVTQPEWSASSRVWLDAKCSWPGLAMARSIGDHCVKSVGVTAEPDIARYDFQQDDAFIVMATDGIWEFLSSDDVVQIVSICMHSPKYKEKHNIAEICAMEVIKCAIKQWKLHEDGYRDDITCSIILLPWLRQQT